MINLLYCFDSNYNLMAFSSIISLLDNISEKINIFIIHSNSDLLNDIPLNIKNHQNLQELNIYKFNKEKHIFPNVEDSHVSEATYYRLFLQDYIPEEIQFLLYLDADVICTKNPLFYFRKKITDIKKNKFIISALTQPGLPKVDQRSIDLGVTSGRYFNAGVMLIDVKKWKNLNVKLKAIEIIIQKNTELMLWDQDVLNIIFNGKYQELDENFNYRMDILEFNEHEVRKLEKNVHLIHYFGKSKPWSIKGVNYGISEYYQKEFRKLGKGRYHIVHNWRKGSILYLFKTFSTGKIFIIKHPFSFVWESIKSFFK